MCDSQDGRVIEICSDCMLNIGICLGVYGRGRFCSISYNPHGKRGSRWETHRRGQECDVDEVGLVLELGVVFDLEKRLLRHPTLTRPACPLVFQHGL
jgi:hypothetical protein